MRLIADCIPAYIADYIVAFCTCLAAASAAISPTARLSLSACLAEWLLFCLLPVCLPVNQLIAVYCGLLRFIAPISCLSARVPGGPWMTRQRRFAAHTRARVRAHTHTYTHMQRPPSHLTSPPAPSPPSPPLLPAVAAGRRRTARRPDPAAGGLCGSAAAAAARLGRTA